MFVDNALALSMTGERNVIDSNIIAGNAVGVALRPAARMGITRVTRNIIHRNGQDVLRCWSGGSCDPKLRRGGIVFGIPAQEHAAYVGERGGGVPVDPAKFTQICPEGAPACQAQPNNGIAAPVLEKITRSGTTLTANGRALAGGTVELFGNRNAGDVEGEIYLGEARVGDRRPVLDDGRCALGERADRLHRHGDVERRRDLGIQPPDRDVGLISRSSS